ncbi:hypothetical protein ABC855_g1770 [[Candida] zeylanoides]
MNYDEYNLAGATAGPVMPTASSDDPFIDDLLFGADTASPPPSSPRPDYTLFGGDATGAPSPGNYDYMNKRGHSNSFSLPTDQLSLLTLRQPSAGSGAYYVAPMPVSHSPSPNLADHAGSSASSATSHAGAGGSGSTGFGSGAHPRHDTGAGAGAGAGAYYSSVEATEERTINPRQLLNHRPLAVSYSSPSLTTLFQQEQAAPHGAVRHRSVAGPPSAAPLTHRDPLLTASSATPRFDFIMNDECFNAIHYWLNTTQCERGDDESAEIIDNPTGVLKFQRRRNSISSGVGDKTGAAIQKKRRRRSFNHDAMRHQRHNSLVESQIDTFAEAHPQSHGPSPATPARGSVSPTLSSIARQHHPSLPFNHLPSQSLDSGVQERTALLPSQRSSAPEAAAALPAAGPSPVFLKPQRFSLKSQASPPQAPAQAAASPRPPGRTSPKKTHDDSDDDSDGEEKPFPCSECSKQFKRSEHLKRHTRSVHSNVRPFHCKYCDKKFSRSDNLAQHLKTHYKTLPNGSTTIILGNPNLFNRGGRKTKGT